MGGGSQADILLQGCGLYARRFAKAIDILTECEEFERDEQFNDLVLKLVDRYKILTDVCDDDNKPKPKHESPKPRGGVSTFW